ncbi:hypothetical protein ABPG72_006448 [Tetrahymena utriculariae]
MDTKNLYKKLEKSQNKNLKHNRLEQKIFKLSNKKSKDISVVVANDNQNIQIQFSKYINKNNWNNFQNQVTKNIESLALQSGRSSQFIKQLLDLLHLNYMRGYFSLSKQKNNYHYLIKAPANSLTLKNLAYNGIFFFGHPRPLQGEQQLAPPHESCCQFVLKYDLQKQIFSDSSSSVIKQYQHGQYFQNVGLKTQKFMQVNQQDQSNQFEETKMLSQQGNIEDLFQDKTNQVIKQRNLNLLNFNQSSIQPITSTIFLIVF